MRGIQEYFANKVVLVTGATGLVGRVLVEKLLRDLGDIRRIYLLIRPRTMGPGKTRSVEERLGSDFLSSSVFDRLRDLHGEGFDSLVREKVVAVEGDLSQERLGLDAATYAQLQAEVQVIINCAAVVTFDAPLDLALHINTLGPLRLLEMARGCQNPVLMAHVSTCYVNGTRQGLVAEEPLDPRQTVAHTNGTTQRQYDVDEEIADITRLIGRVEKQSHRPWQRAAFAWAARRQRNGQERSQDRGVSEGAERLRRNWVERRLAVEGMRWARRRGWNDTYTFTKAMGEQLLVRYLGEVPTLILRPSIVESSMETPVPGWLAGMRMIDPLIVAYGRRQLSDFPGDPQAILDIIPVDMVVNALLAAIPWVQERGGPLVYQVATGTENPITVGRFTELVQDYFRMEPLTGRGNPSRAMPRLTFPSPNRFLRRLRYRYLLPLRWLELLALGASWTAWGRNLRSRYRSRRAGLERLHYYARILGPYAMVRCQYLTQHVWELWGAVGPEEKRRFNFDVSAIDWRHYVQEIHIPGMKRFVLGVSARPSASPATPEESPAEMPEPDSAELMGEGEEPFHQHVVPSSAPPTSGNGSPVTQGKDDGPVSPGSGTALKGAPATAIRLNRRGGIANRRVPMLGAAPQRREVELCLRATPWEVAGRTLTRWLFGLGFRHYLGMTCEGMEHVPDTGPFIVASNHNSHVDTAVLLVLLAKGNRPVHPVAAKDYWFRTPLQGWVSRTFLWAVPFDRQGHPVESLALAVEVLRCSHSLIFFPEGGRSLDGKVRPFRRGIGFLAMASGAPILPVHIDGSFQALPKGRSILRRHPIRVRIGPPIPAEAFCQPAGTEEPQEMARRISEEVQRAVEALA